MTTLPQFVLVSFCFFLLLHLFVVCDWSIFPFFHIGLWPFFALSLFTSLSFALYPSSLFPSWNEINIIWQWGFPALINLFNVNMFHGVTVFMTSVTLIMSRNSGEYSIIVQQHWLRDFWFQIYIWHIFMYYLYFHFRQLWVSRWRNEAGITTCGRFHP